MRTALGILLAAGLLCSCTGGARTTSTTSPPPGVAPERVASIVSCPVGAPVGVRGRFYYPPTYPQEARPNPTRCFGTTSQARAAGFRLAQAPRGALVLGGVYLMPVGSSLRVQCRHAADVAGFPVACPGILPAPVSSADPQNAGPSDFLIQLVFQGPPGYVGASNLSGGGQPIGHMWVESYRGPNRGGQCPGERIVGHLTFRGQPARWISCPEADATDGGHIVVQWFENGVRYDVSVHGHTELNRRIALAIARTVRLVG